LDTRRVTCRAAVRRWRRARKGQCRRRRRHRGGGQPQSSGMRRAGQIGGGRAPVTPCGTGMWCWSASTVGVERGGCGGYRVEGGLGVDRQAGQAVQVSRQQRTVLVSQPMTSARPPLPATTARRRARSQIGEVEGEDLAPGAGGGLIQQATTLHRVGCLTAAGWRGRRSHTASHHRVLSRSGLVGVEDGEQLGRGDGPGARTCAARSDRGRRRSRPVAGEVGGQPWRVV
jgi:hypothetical protein